MEFSFSLNSRSPAEAALWRGEGSSGFVTGAVLARHPALQVPLHHAGWQAPWWLREPVSDLRQTAQGVFARPLPALPAGDLEGRALPVWYKAAVPCEGMYAGGVTICGAGGEALVFVGRRRLAWRGFLDAGQVERISFTVDVVPLISEGDSAPDLNLSVDVSVVGAGLQGLTLSPAPAGTRRVFLLGDSTVTDQSAAIPYAPGTSYAGWGEMLPWFLPPGYCVSNHAHSGLTTESFTAEGHWALAEERLRPGDLVLMQFGHNDQKLPHLDAWGGYTKRLRAYLDAVRAKGAQPVLVTPLARNSWTPAGLYNDLLADYAQAVQRLGQQTHTRVIDLHGSTMEQITRAGREDSKRWFYPGDYTHANDFGAFAAAAFVAQALSPALDAPACKRAPWPPAGPRTPLAPPAGMTPPEADPYAAFAQDGPLTRGDTAQLVVAALHLFPVNGYRSPFADVVGESPLGTAVQCAVQAGLLPARWAADGCLHPAAPVTLGEFLAVLLPGYAIRCPLPAGPDALAQAQAAGLLPSGLPRDPAAGLRRSQAVEICRRVRI